MNEKKTGLQGIIQELRNRRVFRVAAVYLGIGFAVLEAADIIIPMLGLPDVIMLVILGLLMIGFPIATVLSWHLQITEDGIRRSPTSGEKQTPDQKPFTSNALIVVLLLIIVILLAYPRFKGEGSSNLVDPESTQAEIVSIDNKSIAVLPFTNFSASEEDAYFADGIHDDILTQLSKIGDLKVISRTTMMKYKASDLSISEIASEVGADNVLEGSVRRAGDQIRIVAQLIKAKSDEHLWAETYDREYADIFSIQSDVARKIASALKSTLTPAEEQQLEDIPTTNMEAYDYFLRGNTYWYTKTTKEGNLKAVAMYEKSVDLDPTFGLAFARLSIVHAVLYQSSNWDPTPERKELARLALEKAKVLIPEHGETRFAQGIYYLWCEGNSELALAEFEIASMLNPNSGEIVQHMGQLYVFAGKWEEAERYLTRAYELQPHDVGNAGWLGGYHFLTRNFEKAELYYRKELHVNPEMAQIYRWYADVWAYGFGDIDKALGLFNEGSSMADNPESLVRYRFWHELDARDYSAAFQTAKNYKSNSRNYYLSVVHFLTEKSGIKSPTLDSALVNTIERKLETEEAEAFRQGRIGLIKAMQGEKQAAIEAGKRALEIFPVSGDALNGPDQVYRLAEIYAVVGESNLALEVLEDLLSYPNTTSIWRIKLNPFFDSLRENPRYLKLIDEKRPSA